VGVPRSIQKGMTQNAIAPRNGGRNESTFQLQAAPPLSWGGRVLLAIGAKLTYKNLKN
jgi:hypothetical protein